MNNDKTNTKNKAAKLNNISDKTQHSSKQVEPAWDYDFQASTQSFDDALFSDDDALNQAVAQAAQKNSEKTSPTKQNQTEKQLASALAVKIDFSVFLSPASKAKTFSVPKLQPSPSSTHLTTVNKGVNAYPVRSVIEKLDGITEATPSAPKKPPIVNTQTQQIPALKTHKLSPLINTIKKMVCKAKARFDEYFGRTLPERVLTLDFQFSVKRQKKGLDCITTNRDIKRLFSYKGASLSSIFKQANTDLDAIVKFKLSQSHQQQLLDHYTPPLVEKFRLFITVLEKKSGVFNDKKRQETILHTQNTIKYLIAAYKQIYAHMYQLPNYCYGPKRASINDCVYRLIDLLCLEQHLFNALQRSLPASSIKTMNKLYNALSLYEPQLLESEKESLTFVKTKSITSLFLRYQITLCFDMMKLPSTQHRIFYRYIEHNLPLLTPEPSGKSPHGTRLGLTITHNLSELPALQTPQNKDNDPAIFIHTQQFFNQVKQDYNECLTLIGSQKTTHKSKAFSGTTIHEALSICTLGIQCINHIENHIKRHEYIVFKPFEQKTYTNIANIIAYLNYRQTQQNSTSASKGEPSAIKKPTAAPNQWQYAMEDQNIVHLQTSEIKSEQLIDIGVTLLLVKTVDDTDKLQLARIIRMERVQQAKLNLVLEKLGDTLTHIDLPNETNKPHTAIISLHNNNYYLVGSFKQDYWTGKTLNIALPDLSESVISIDALQSNSPWTQVYTLS